MPRNPEWKKVLHSFLHENNIQHIDDYFIDTEPVDDQFSDARFIPVYPEDFGRVLLRINEKSIYLN